MYKNMIRFFNSDQWRAITIQRLLKEQEELASKLTYEEQQEAVKAVVQLYSYALDLMRSHPEISVSEAMDLIDIRRT